jgi:tetratricopeptide (TPR) repeat protein
MSNASRMLKTIGALALTAVAALGAASPEMEHARKLYDLTNFDQSLKVLNAIPDKDAEAYELMGRNQYMQSEFKKASESFEKAFAADPTNSQYALWLGRAHGRRAENATPFTAPSQATKARQYFEKAVQLDPKNLEALADLFEYYLEAPGFLGGGLDKADKISRQMAELDPGEGQWSQAKLAERRKDFGSAEQHLRRAIDLGPRQVGRLIDLAHFLGRQGRIPEAEENLAKADKVAPDSPKLIYSKAEFYVKHKMNPDAARDLLKRYLSMNLTPEDPSRAQAEKLLRQVQGS